MNAPLPAVPLSGLSLVLLPALAAVWILARWCRRGGEGLYALARMVLQLVAIGHVLAFLFRAESVLLVLLALWIMLVAASWIALRPAGRRNSRQLLRALGAIALGGLSTLALVVAAVLPVESWRSPRYVIPLAGMIFANSMNAVSLALERFGSEIEKGSGYERARSEAYRTALIPTINSLLATGIVALPGMMTGQILSGVPPEVAVRYQIVVMCMILGAPGISATCYLAWARRDQVRPVRRPGTPLS